MSADKINDIELDDLLLFLEEGDMRDAPPKIVQYVQVLEMIWGMHKRMLDFPNNESIINHLVLSRGFAREKSRQLVKDALVYFHSENQLPKDTWRSIVGDKGMKAFVASIRLAKSSKDYKDAFSILLDLGKFLGWDTPDAEKPDESFIRQLQILTADLPMFGLPSVNRAEIGKLIDDLPDISDKMKAAAKAEVDGVPFQLLYKEENPRSNE